MTGAVEVRRRDALPVTAAQLELWQTQAKHLADSDMVKGGYRGKPGNIIAAAMIGAELGWTLMFSLQNIHSWTTPRKRKIWDPDTRDNKWISEDEPTTAISAQAQSALLTEAGHSYILLHYSAEEITVIGERCDRVCRCPERCPAHFPLTMRRDDPDLAHLAGRGKKGDDNYLPGRTMWRDHPRRMLWWRTVTELVVIMCPEVTMGMTASPDDAPTYEPPVSQPPATLDRVAARPADAISATATEVADSPDPATGVGSGPAPPGAPAPTAKRRAQDAVLAGVGGDRDLARRCWDEMVAKAPWPAYPDPESWAQAWLAARHPPPLVAVDAVEEVAPVVEMCDHKSRDGRLCVRGRHESKNHKYAPVEVSEGSGIAASSRPDAISEPDPSDTLEDPLMFPDGDADAFPPGHEPFGPPDAA